MCIQVSLILFKLTNFSEIHWVIVLFPLWIITFLGSFLASFHIVACVFKVFLMICKKSTIQESNRLVSKLVRFHLHIFGFVSTQVGSFIIAVITINPFEIEMNGGSRTLSRQSIVIMTALGTVGILIYFLFVLIYHIEFREYLLLISGVEKHSPDELSLQEISQVSQNNGSKKIKVKYPLYLVQS